MTNNWSLEGSITINGAVDAGRSEILRGSAETWIGTLNGGDRKHLSLLCVDRRMLLGDGDDAHIDAHTSLSAPARGHPPRLS